MVILVITMLNDLSEIFNEEIRNIKMEIENTKKNQSEIQNTITEMKDKLQKKNEQWIDDAED